MLSWRHKQRKWTAIFETTELTIVRIKDEYGRLRFAWIATKLDDRSKHRSGRSPYWESAAAAAIDAGRKLHLYG